ncbi:ChbG/HpnK family deacetylase [Azospirillum halopraeferens]|uniref:ChbG/HpnK family deacetylase n=1 Tax=Azospirillum halopraeferens TaxID=34010 RepID=UPI00041DDA12|nr:ChbG/HpnK family deacetylase [Azospirillum halopraeferens]
MPHRRPTASVILCADDYGLAPGVGVAIRDLIGRGRLTATSCMTVCPFWPEEAERLKPLAGLADVGLHLTLTDQAPLGPMPVLAPRGRLPPLAVLMRRAFAGRLDAAEIAAEVDRQVAAFTAAFGAPPAYIDGHQHVHQLPVVREAVVAALARLPGAYVRLCREPRTAVVRRGVAVAKTLLISELGGGLAALARAAGIPANDGFRGVYDFGGRAGLAELMPRFLDRPQGRTLVMVHPGIPDDALRAADTLVEPRAAEYDYLGGSAFGALLDGAGIRPARFA